MLGVAAARGLYGENADDSDAKSGVGERSVDGTGDAEEGNVTVAVADDGSEEDEGGSKENVSYVYLRNGRPVIYFVLNH